MTHRCTDPIVEMDRLEHARSSQLTRFNPLEIVGNKLFGVIMYPKPLLALLSCLFTENLQSKLISAMYSCFHITSFRTTMKHERRPTFQTSNSWKFLRCPVCWITRRDNPSNSLSETSAADCIPVSWRKACIFRMTGIDAAEQLRNQLCGRSRQWKWPMYKCSSRS